MSKDEDVNQQSDATDDAEPGQESDRAALRDKFREALERKKGARGIGSARSTDVGHPHSAPAKTQRTFRRKSG